MRHFSNSVQTVNKATHRLYIYLVNILFLYIVAPMQEMTSHDKKLPTSADLLMLLAEAAIPELEFNSCSKNVQYIDGTSQPYNSKQLIKDSESSSTGFFRETSNLFCQQPNFFHNLRDIVQYIDADTQLRHRVLAEFQNRLKTLPDRVQNNVQIDENLLILPQLEYWLQDHSSFSPLIDALAFSISHATSRDASLDSSYWVQPITNNVYIPSATKSDHFPNNEAQETDATLSISPFGTDYLANLEKLICLQTWAPTLDKLAPSDKIAIWRICQLIPSFGNNFDAASFRKTINKWVQDPINNMMAVNLLFSAIGYLKHHGVLKHEFFYPKTLVPVFKTGDELNDKNAKRRRRRRKNSQGPTDANIPVVPLSINKRPNPPFKFATAQNSAFNTPLFASPMEEHMDIDSHSISEDHSVPVSHKRSFSEMSLSETTGTHANKENMDPSLKAMPGVWQQSQKRRKLDTSGGLLNAKTAGSSSPSSDGDGVMKISHILCH
jgi:hypothetical protein